MDRAFPSPRKPGCSCQHAASPMEPASDPDNAGTANAPPAGTAAAPWAVLVCRVCLQRAGPTEAAASWCQQTPATKCKLGNINKPGFYFPLQLVYCVSYSMKYVANNNNNNNNKSCQHKKKREFGLGPVMGPDSSL